MYEHAHGLGGQADAGGRAGLLAFVVDDGVTDALLPEILAEAAGEKHAPSIREGLAQAVAVDDVGVVGQLPGVETRSELTV